MFIELHRVLKALKVFGINREKYKEYTKSVRGVKPLYVSDYQVKRGSRSFHSPFNILCLLIIHNLRTLKIQRIIIREVVDLIQYFTKNKRLVADAILFKKLKSTIVIEKINNHSFVNLIIIDYENNQQHVFSKQVGGKDIDYLLLPLYSNMDHLNMIQIVVNINNIFGYIEHLWEKQHDETMRL